MENKRVKGFSLRVWARRLFFGPAKELNFLEEEQVQSPMRSMIKRFLHNKVAMTGVGTVKYYAQIHLQVWQNSVCTGQGNLPLIT